MKTILTLLLAAVWIGIVFAVIFSDDEDEEEEEKK